MERDELAEELNKARATQQELSLTNVQKSSQCHLGSSWGRSRCERGWSRSWCGSLDRNMPANGEDGSQWRIKEANHRKLHFWSSSILTGVPKYWRTKVVPVPRGLFGGCLNAGNAVASHHGDLWKRCMPANQWGKLKQAAKNGRMHDCHLCILKRLGLRPD
jgi:hypothetical protein